MPEINFLAVLIGAVALQVLGFLWYGPLFGKKWMAAMGWGPEKIEEAKKQGGMGKTYALAFVSALVMSYVMAHVIWAWEMASPEFAAQPMVLGAMTGFFSWLGFIATSSSASVLWEERPKALYALNNGYNLVGLMIVGVIVALL